MRRISAPTEPLASLAWLAVLPAGVGLGYLVASRGAAAAAPLLLALAVYALPRRSLYGLSAGISLVLVVPYWHTLGSPQAGLMRIAVLAALATCLFARGLRPTAVDLSVVAIILVSVLGWILQDSQPGVGRILLTALLPLAFFVAARTVSSDNVPKVMSVALMAGAVGAVTVIYESLVGHLLFADPTSYSWNVTDSTIFRPGGIFGSPPGAATVLALTALFGLSTLSTTGRFRGVAWIALGVTVLACVLTFTRASLIGLGGGVLVYLWLSRSPLLRPGRVVVASLVLVVMTITVLPRLESSTLFQRGIVRPGNLAARESYWRLALPIAEASPRNFILGIGSARTVVSKLGGNTPVELAAAPELVNHGTHNQYVLALLEQGLIGLAVLLAWLITTLVVGIRGRQRSTDPSRAALVGSVVAFAVVMLANNSMLHPPSLAMGALASGLLVARQTNRASSKTPPGATASAS